MLHSIKGCNTNICTLQMCTISSQSNVHLSWMAQWLSMFKAHQFLWPKAWHPADSPAWMIRHHTQGRTAFCKIQKKVQTHASGAVTRCLNSSATMPCHNTFGNRGTQHSWAAATYRDNSKFWSLPHQWHDHISHFSSCTSSTHSLPCPPPPILPQTDAIGGCPGHPAQLCLWFAIISIF